jgi:SEC-C motif-containing protein
MSLLKLPKRQSPCPCHSGLTFAECCNPLLRGEPAATAEALMRSRFTAFAVGDGDYLWRTLHPDHPDRAIPRDVWLATMRRETRDNRYLGLKVLGASEAGDRATVTFLARIMRHARDASFGERSLFARTSDGWLYLSGETLPPGEVSP